MRTSIFVVLALSLISQASFHQLDDGTTGLQPAHEARHHPHPPGADVLAKPQKRSSNPERRSGKSKASQKRHSKAVKKRKVVELERRRAEEIERRREAEELERRLAIFDKLFGGGVLKAKSSCGASNSSSMFDSKSISMTSQNGNCFQRRSLTTTAPTATSIFSIAVLIQIRAGIHPKSRPASVCQIVLLCGQLLIELI